MELTSRLRLLGIPESSTDLHWIAEQSLAAPLIDGWEASPNGGFINAITKEFQQEDPSIDYYRQLYRSLSKATDTPAPVAQGTSSKSGHLVTSVRDEFAKYEEKIRGWVIARIIPSNSVSEADALPLELLLDMILQSDLVLPSSLPMDAILQLILLKLSTAAGVVREDFLVSFLSSVRELINSTPSISDAITKSLLEDATGCANVRNSICSFLKLDEPAQQGGKFDGTALAEQLKLMLDASMNQHQSERAEWEAELAKMRQRAEVAERCLQRLQADSQWSSLNNSGCNCGAQRRLSKKKSLILELRERNKDLSEANAKLSQELVESVGWSRQLEQQTEHLRLERQPPPYRVVSNAVERLQKDLRAHSDQADELALGLALAAADRDEQAQRAQHGAHYIGLLEGQIQALQEQLQSQTELYASAQAQLRQAEGVQDRLIRNIHELRRDCDRFSLRICKREKSCLQICRFTDSSSGTSCVTVQNDAVVVASQRYKFDRVVGRDPESLFDEIEPSVRNVLHGNRFCVMLFGDSRSNHENAVLGDSLVHCILRFLLSVREVDTGRVNTFISISAGRIHQERCYDMLCDENEAFVRTSGEDIIVMEGLSSYPVLSMAEVQSLLTKVAANQSSQAHHRDRKLPDRSSCHIVFSFEVKRVNIETGGEVMGSIQVVVLAACDHYKLGASGGMKSQWRFKEGQFVNRSLACLQDVLTTVYGSEEEGDLLPNYRGSVLTLWLHQYLSRESESKLAFCVHVDSNRDEADMLPVLNYLHNLQ